MADFIFYTARDWAMKMRPKAAAAWLAYDVAVYLLCSTFFLSLNARFIFLLAFTGLIATALALVKMALFFDSSKSDEAVEAAVRRASAYVRSARVRLAIALSFLKGRFILSPE